MTAYVTRDRGEFGFFVGAVAESGTFALDLSTTSANIALLAGQYVAILKSTDAALLAICRTGTVAAFPTTGDSKAGFLVRGASDGARFQLAEDATLHAILSGGTATIYFVKLV